MPKLVYANEYQAIRAKYKRTQKFKNEAYQALTVRFHKVKDADIIEKLDSVENKRDFLKRLIREAIAENK